MTKEIRKKYSELDLKLGAMVADMKEEVKIKNKLEIDWMRLNYRIMSRCLAFLDMQDEEGKLKQGMSREMMQLAGLSGAVSTYFSKLKLLQDGTHDLETAIMELILKLNDKAEMVKEDKISDKELINALEDVDHEAAGYRDMQMKYFSQLDTLKEELDSLKTKSQIHIN